MMGPPEPVVPPSSMPNVPAPSPADFGLDRIESMNALFSINKELGSLRTSTEYLNRDIRELKEESRESLQNLKEKDLAEIKSELKEQGQKLSNLDKKIYAAMAIVALAGAVLGPVVTFLLGKYLK